MLSNGRLEITTQIGCKIACLNCPQKLLLDNYSRLSPLRVMSLRTFEDCISRVPPTVRIDFSGFSEPWQNQDCTKMLLSAAARGHRIAVYSTLVGMRRADVDAIADIPFEAFVIHLPDSEGHSNIPLTEEYLDVLNRCLELFLPLERRSKIGSSCHGALHPLLETIIPDGFFNIPASQGIEHRMVDRAGLLDDPALRHRRLPGPIMCFLCNRQLNHNVLLPDGSVVLCCMDYALNHVLGNLLENSYASLFNGSSYRQIQASLEIDNISIPCRYCHNAAPLEPSFRWEPASSTASISSATHLEKFVHFIADRQGHPQVAKFIFDSPICLPDSGTEPSIIFSPNARSHLGDPSSLAELRRLVNRGWTGVLFVPSLLPHESANSFMELLKAADCWLDFSGIVKNMQGDDSWLAVLGSEPFVKMLPAPLDFRVTALLAAYNEADIICEVVQDLIYQGVGVYLIDNWSSDGTFEACDQFLGRGLVGRERFPAAGPTSTYNWNDILKRKEELSRMLDSDWFIHCDADELREAPWPNVSLKDALYRIDREGFNAVDHTVLDFRPVDADSSFPLSLRRTFSYFEFGTRPGHFHQTKTWKNLGRPVDLASSAGHLCRFEDIRVYPYKFLLRHYPFRTQVQAERKVFIDRRARWNPEERSRGWHIQYEAFESGHSFIWPREDLLFFDSTFYAKFMFERLTGVGIMEWRKNLPLRH